MGTVAAAKPELELSHEGIVLLSRGLGVATTPCELKEIANFSLKVSVEFPLAGIWCLLLHRCVSRNVFLSQNRAWL